jgi:phosphoesterase RecJ-like protein
MNNTQAAAAGAALQKAQRVLLSAHIRPDGDAVGSLLGMGLALAAAGKQVSMVLSDGVPGSLQHLHGSELIKYRSEGEFDLVVVLDSSELSRVGAALEGRGAPDINIDHHVTNVNFANLNLVDTTAAATAEMLAILLPQWGFELDQASASALLTGIITDTIGFRTSNMTSRVMRIAAQLMDLGADLSTLYYQALAQRSYEAMRMWGAGLSQLQREEGLVWAVLTLEDRKAAGYRGRDDADLVNVLSAIKGAEIAVMFIEQPGRKIKISWRAQPGVDVTGLALQFGGGGHPAAAGAEVEGSLIAVQKQVLEETMKLLGQHHPIVSETSR